MWLHECQNVWQRNAYHMIGKSFTVAPLHDRDVIMSATVCQTTWVSIVYSTVCSGVDQRKHQGSASLAFVRGIHRWPMNSPHKGPVTLKMLPFNVNAMRFHAKFCCRRCQPEQVLTISRVSGDLKRHEYCCVTVRNLQITSYSYECYREIMGITVKLVSNDHLSNEIYYLWFIQ